MRKDQDFERAARSGAWALALALGVVMGCSGASSDGDSGARPMDAGSTLDARVAADTNASDAHADASPLGDAARGDDASGEDANAAPLDAWTMSAPDAYAPDAYVGHDAAAPIDACARTCGPTHQCGSDGCGGSCGPCGASQVCLATNLCCTPSCSGRTCGSDGCGGSCGACGSNAACNATGQCQCNAGFYPSPAGTFCIPPTGACTGTGVGNNGYCADARNWIWCDPVLGLRRLDCTSAGLGGCVTVGPGAGACACAGPSASITTTGQCGTIAGGADDGIYRCNAAYGVIYSVNCRDHNPSGFCATFATAFGSGPSCMCGACNPYDTTRNLCLGSPCPGSCGVTSGNPPLHACL